MFSDIAFAFVPKALAKSQGPQSEKVPLASGCKSLLRRFMMHLQCSRLKCAAALPCSDMAALTADDNVGRSSPSPSDSCS